LALAQSRIWLGRTTRLWRSGIKDSYGKRFRRRLVFRQVKHRVLDSGKRVGTESFLLSSQTLLLQELLPRHSCWVQIF